MAGVCFGQQLETGPSEKKRYRYPVIPAESENHAFIWNSVPQYYLSNDIVYPMTIAKNTYLSVDKKTLEIRELKPDEQLKKKVKKPDLKHFGGGKESISSLYENSEGVGLAYFEPQKLVSYTTLWPTADLGPDFTAAEGERFRQVYSNRTGNFFLVQESYYNTIAKGPKELYEVKDYYMLFDQKGKLVHKNHFSFNSLGEINDDMARRISPAARYGILDSGGSFLFMAGGTIALLDASDDYDLKTFPLALNQPRLGAKLKRPHMQITANGDLLVALSYTTVKDMETLPFFGVTPNEKSLGIFLQKHRASDKEIIAFNLVELSSSNEGLSSQSQSALQEMAETNSLKIRRVLDDGEGGHLLLVQEEIESNIMGSTSLYEGRVYLLAVDAGLQPKWASQLPVSQENVNALARPLNPLILASDSEIYLLAANKMIANQPEQGASLLTFNKESGDWRQSEFELPLKLADFNVIAVTPGSNYQEQIALVSNAEGTHAIRFKL